MNNDFEVPCIITAFAMALDTSTEKLIELIGHDGQEVVSIGSAFPHIGFHIQECIHAAHELGFSVTPFEYIPVHNHPASGESPIMRESIYKRFDWLVRTSIGVMTGNTFRSGHAVAFDTGTIFDPRGHVFEYQNVTECQKYRFFPKCIWIVRKHVS